MQKYRRKLLTEEQRWNFKTKDKFNKIRDSMYRQPVILIFIHFYTCELHNSTVYTSFFVPDITSSPSNVVNTWKRPIMTVSYGRQVSALQLIKSSNILYQFSSTANDLTKHFKIIDNLKWQTAKYIKGSTRELVCVMHFCELDSEENWLKRGHVQTRLKMPSSRDDHLSKPGSVLFDGCRTSMWANGQRDMMVLKALYTWMWAKKYY